MVDLIETLNGTGLLEPAQRAEFAARWQGRFDEPEPLAHELVEQGWITTYQAAQLLEGKGENLRLDAYVLLEPLENETGERLFKARRQGSGRQAVVKRISRDRFSNEEAVRRFLSEAESASRVTHPNLVSVLDAGPAGSDYYVAREYVEGTDLETLVRREGPVPAGLACEFIRQASLALQYARERGLVYRDIRPAKLLVGPKGDQIKILDPGLAALQPPPSAPPSLIDFSAPEVTLEPQSSDLRATIHSLGCTLYFLLTGEHPASEAVPAERLPPDTPPELVTVICKMTALRRRERYPTQAKVAAALAPFCGVKKRVAYRPQEKEIPPPPVRATSVKLEPVQAPLKPNISEEPILSKSRAQPRRRGRKSVIAAAIVFAIMLGVVVRTLSKGPSSPSGPPVNTRATVEPDKQPDAAPPAIKTPKVEAVPAVVALAPTPTRPTPPNELASRQIQEGAEMLRGGDPRAGLQRFQNAVIELGPGGDQKLREKALMGRTEARLQIASALVQAGKFADASEQLRDVETSANLQELAADQQRHAKVLRELLEAADRARSDSEFSKLSEPISFLIQTEARLQTKQTTPADRIAAFDACAKLVEQVSAEIEAPGPSAPAVDRLLIQPAIRLGERLAAGNSEPELRAKLARMFAARGRLLGKERYAAWPIDPLRERVGAYDRAISMDGMKAEYFAARGEAQASLVPLDLDKIKIDAETALALDTENAVPGGHNLRGFVLLLEWRKANRKENLNQLRESIKEFSQAIDISGRNARIDDDLPVYLANRILARVALAAYAPDEGERQAARELARSDGKKAVQLKRSVLDTVHRTLAASLEELREYPDAVAEYSKAVDVAKLPANRTLALLDRGRCRYKWGMADAKERGVALTASILDLEEVLHADAKSAEAAYLLGLAYLGRNAAGDSSRSADSLAMAIGLETDPIRQAGYIKVAADAALGRQDLDQARKLGDRLKVVRPLEGALVLGQVLARENRLADSVTTYTEALGTKSGEHPPLLEAQVLLARASTILKTEDLWKSDRRRDPPQSLTDADRAAELGRTDRQVRSVALVTGAIARGRLLVEGSLPPETRESYFREASEHLESALALMPGHPESWSWRESLANLLVQRIVAAPAERAQLLPKARELVSQALENAPSPEARDRLARLKEMLEKN